jgi:hypothetical protein
MALEVIEAGGFWHMRLRYLGRGNPATSCSVNPSACGTAMGLISGSVAKDTRFSDQCADF